ncbi:MAG: endonuclease/exonuclease/phosphatase family protein [Flavobacteriales bacterium]|nr:endonuclease/exonuclease/phosphatase family protein [Flavobacteriales bacterium]
MKNYSFQLAFACLLFIWSPECSFGQDGKLKVLSFNIRYNNPNDGENSWPNRSERVKNFLWSESPDIIGFQEVLHNEFLELDRALFNYNFSERQYTRIGVGREDGKTKGEYSPIYFRSNRFQLISSKTVWLSETPNKPSKGWDAACERIATFALLFDEELKDTLLVVNAHWDHVGVLARQESAKLILNEMNNYSSIQNKILMGDFNCTPEDPALKKLRAEFSDAGIGASSKVGTFNNFERAANPKAPRIDYVFYKLKNLGFHSYKVGNTDVAEPLLSDHFPIVVEFEQMNSKLEGRFQFNINKTPLEYTDSLLHIETLKCYVGHIEILDRNRQIIGRDSFSYRLLDFHNSNSLNFSVNTNSNYASYVRLTLGVDSITNAAGVHCCALDPANGMYWSWQSGYIQFKLEGKEKDGNALNLHLGGFSNAYMSSITDDIPILRMVTGGPVLPPDRRSQVLTIHLKLDSFMELVHANKEYSLMSPNNHVQEYMRALCASFSAIMK